MGSWADGADSIFIPKDQYTRRTGAQIQAMVDAPARIGDIVASGIEPGEPYGRIVAFDHSKQGIGFVIVQPLNGGEIRRGYFPGFTGYCPRDEWDGPTPNRLGEFIWKD